MNSSPCLSEPAGPPSPLGGGKATPAPGARWTHAAELSGVHSSVARARSFVTRRLADHGVAHLADDVRMVVSELATNALVHGHSGFTVVLSGEPASVRVEVLDASPMAPVLRTAGDGTALHGRGLAIVAALSRDWGVTDQTAHGKTVWAEFATREV